MKQLNHLIVQLLGNKSFLRDYVCAVATRSARRSILRMHSSKPSMARHPISHSTEELEQLRMFLDKHLKLDKAQSVKTTANTFMGDVPYCDVEVDTDIAKALYEAGTFLRKLVLDWKQMNSPRYEQVQSKFLKERAEDELFFNFDSTNPKVTLEDLDDYTTGENSMGFTNIPTAASGPSVRCADGNIATTTAVTSTAKTKEVITMIKVEKQTLLNGNRIETFSDDAIYNMISAAEKKVEELETIKNKPKRLVKEIESRRADIQTLVDYLDSKES
jgi:hypothetical protein